MHFWTVPLLVRCRCVSAPARVCVSGLPSLTNTESNLFLDSSLDLGNNNNNNNNSNNSNKNNSNNSNNRNSNNQAPRGGLWNLSRNRDRVWSSSRFFKYFGGHFQWTIRVWRSERVVSVNFDRSARLRGHDFDSCRFQRRLSCCLLEFAPHFNDSLYWCWQVFIGLRVCVFDLNLSSHSLTPLLSFHGPHSKFFTGFYLVLFLLRLSLDAVYRRCGDFFYIDAFHDRPMAVTRSRNGVH